MPEIYMGISLMAFSKYLFKIVKSVESTLLSLFKSAAFLNFSSCSDVPSSKDLRIYLLSINKSVEFTALSKFKSPCFIEGVGSEVAPISLILSTTNFPDLCWHT